MKLILINLWVNSLEFWVLFDGHWWLLTLEQRLRSDCLFGTLVDLNFRGFRVEKESQQRYWGISGPIRVRSEPEQDHSKRLIRRYLWSNFGPHRREIGGAGLIFVDVCGVDPGRKLCFQLKKRWKDRWKGGYLHGGALIKTPVYSLMTEYRLI